MHACASLAIQSPPLPEFIILEVSAGTAADFEDVAACATDQVCALGAHAHDFLGHFDVCVEGACGVVVAVGNIVGDREGLRLSDFATVGGIEVADVGAESEGADAEDGHDSGRDGGGRGRGREILEVLVGAFR